MSMEKVLKYRIWCQTDLKYEYVILEEGIAAPTKCPTNDDHDITLNSVAIVDNLAKDTIITEKRIGKTSDKMKLRGFNFTAVKTTSTSFTYTVSEELYIKDGLLITDKNVPFDKIDIELLSPDDTLLHTYVKDYPLCKSGMTGFTDETLSETDFNGLKLKLTYHSIGTVDDIKCEMQLNGSI